MRNETLEKQVDATSMTSFAGMNAKPISPWQIAANKKKTSTTTISPPWQHHTIEKSSSNLQQTSPTSTPTQSRYRARNSTSTSPLLQLTMTPPIRCANASGS